MYIVNFKPKTPSLRFKQIYRKFYKFKKKQYLNGILNKITLKLNINDNKSKLIYNKLIRNKKKYSLLNHYANYNSYIILKIINNSSKKKKTNLIIKDIFGNYKIIPNILGLLPGRFVSNFFKYYKIWKNLDSLDYFGFFINLKFITFNVNVNNIFIKIYKSTYSTSPGVFSIKKQRKILENYNLIELSSKKTKILKLNCFSFLGKNYYFGIKKINYGKASVSFLNNYKQTVRGVCKNPCDHPNGGRTKSKTPERSPWGWIAKKNK